MHLREEEAAGRVKVPAGRKEARRAISHPADANRWALADTDMTCAVHVGYLLAAELLELTGHKPVLKKASTLPKIMQRYISITQPKKVRVNVTQDRRAATRPTG
jgi:hypothetical protein